MLLTLLRKLFLGMNVLLILLLPNTALAAEQQLAYEQKVVAEQWYEQGNEYLKQKDYDNAILAYNKAAEVLTDYVNLYLFRALAYERIGKYDLAIEDYSNLIELKPDYDFAYEQRARMYVKTHQYVYALSDYTKLIELQPHDTRNYIYRGITYQRMGKNDLAQENFRVVINYYTDSIVSFPDKADNYRVRGNVYGYSGMYSDAISDYKKSLSLNPQDAIAYFRLAQAYELMGKKEEALINYQIAYNLIIPLKNAAMKDHVTKIELRLKGDWNNYKEWI